MKLVSKVKGMVSDVKQHWTTPKPGRLVPYKEVAAYGFGGMGIYWATILSSQIGLSANNFLVGHAINLKPVDLQIMLNIANLIGFAITFVRSYFYDNINSKDGKIRPFLKWSLVPLAVLSTAFVWMPYERMEYYQKVIVVEIFYLAISFFSPYVTEGFYMLAQVMSSDSNERTDVMSIGQLLMSFAPTLSNLFVPYLAMLTGGMTDLRTYRIIYPIISIVGLPLAFLTYSGTRERIIKPKDEPFSVTFKDAIVTISKNKYYWIINIAGWIGFLESASGVILTWTFVYGMPEKQQHMGLATTIISNGALWAMLSAPFIIRKLGKRNLLIGCNIANVILLSLLYPFYKNMIAVIVISYINNFFSVFYNIYFYGLNADMKDYHQYKFRERVDGMFAVVGTIGTVLGFGTGMVIPVLYQRMGLKDDYSVLYDATIRENLFEVLIIASIVGAILNVIPYFFYDMTEQKHAGIVKVLKLRAMFGDYAAGNADPEQLLTVPGVGENTAVLLKLVPALAAKYLASRTDPDTILRSSQDLYQIFSPYFFGTRNEMSYLACFDSKLKLLGIRKLSEGTPMATEIGVRQIASAALALNATAVVLAHNHPSGLATPSNEDISTTRYIQEVLRKLDITHYDHVILADDDMVSLRDSGYFLALHY